MGAAILAVAATGFLCLANGLVIARLRIQPFIATLATMIGVRGLARSITSNANIDIGFGTDSASLFSRALSSKTVVIGSFAVLAAVCPYS